MICLQTAQPGNFWLHFPRRRGTITIDSTTKKEGTPYDSDFQFQFDCHHQSGGRRPHLHPGRRIRTGISVAGRSRLLDGPGPQPVPLCGAAVSKDLHPARQSLPHGNPRLCAPCPDDRGRTGGNWLLLPPHRLSRDPGHLSLFIRFPHSIHSRGANSASGLPG